MSPETITLIKKAEGVRRNWTYTPINLIHLILILIIPDYRLSSKLGFLYKKNIDKFKNDTNYLQKEYLKCYHKGL